MFERLVGPSLVLGAHLSFARSLSLSLSLLLSFSSGPAFFTCCISAPTLSLYLTFLPAHSSALLLPSLSLSFSHPETGFSPSFLLCDTYILTYTFNSSRIRKLTSGTTLEPEGASRFLSFQLSSLTTQTQSQLLIFLRSNFDQFFHSIKNFFHSIKNFFVVSNFFPLKVFQSRQFFICSQL